jgi:hypothetical protein
VAQKSRQREMRRHGKEHENKTQNKGEGEGKEKGRVHPCGLNPMQCMTGFVWSHVALRFVTTSYVLGYCCSTAVMRGSARASFAGSMPKVMRK